MLTAETIQKAYQNIKNVVNHAPLQYSARLSNKYKAKIYLKREDLQTVRSYKIRGAYNLISSLSEEEKSRGVICASAGNHAQGFAYACASLGIRGIVYMPEVTPVQKINKVKKFGGQFVHIELVGRTFDEAFQASKRRAEDDGLVYVHPFDDERTIAGQGTVGIEILEDLPDTDIIIVPIGGGGLISGISTYAKSVISGIKVFGVDPAGAPKAVEALNVGHPVELTNIDTFIDGAAIKKIGTITFNIIKEKVDKVFVVPEGKVCTSMIELYQEEGIIAEPAGALAVAALDSVESDTQGKNVVCIISGGNNDISRYPEIMERSLIYEGLKHYFIIEFAQKPGQLKLFLDTVGVNFDIVRFEYLKKTNKEFGPALVGIELHNKEDYNSFIEGLNKSGFRYFKIDSNDMLYRYLV
ncbi:MAG: L-threonine dehydratase biosynthetic IlvA [Candidatus Dojkabacteria bacterium]|nr:MAG: L-threonine dehydratase biosynthetic IlvA [Candidatus Dojkabacteria bacterium]